MLGKANWLERSARRMGGAVALSLLLMATHVAFAQLPTATILGVVKDATGAVVPGANLTARNVETGQTRTTVSGGDGSYRFSAMPVGSYEVQVTTPGFQTEVRSGLTLTVSQEAAVNFTLQVGAVEQRIEVTAEAPLVNTTSGSLGGLVDEQKVAELPLNGRNYIDLTLLQPGVTQQKNMALVGPVGMTGVFFSSSGAPVRSNNYMLDGAIMQNLYSANAASASGSTLGVEGIREYRVVTNSFSAEYGMNMGSQMVVVSKGGTNEFHGSLFEYLRNSALDARNFFDIKTATTPRRLPGFTRNNFGAAFGGPIKQDKTFFHAVYEGLRERLGRTIISRTIPASAKVDGGLVPQIAPVIKPWLTLFPDPNLPNNEFTFPFSQPTNENYGQVRVDQTFSSNDNLFVRYTINDGELINPKSYPQLKDIGESRGQWLTLSESHIFTPTLLNTFRFSYSRTRNALETVIGISGPEFSLVPGEEIGGINIGGLSGFAPTPSAPVNQRQYIFTWSDDLFYSRGRHSVKFGTLINRYQQFPELSSLLRGQIDFANLSSFLRGQPSSYVAASPGSHFAREYHSTTLGFYVQDDLRVRSNLTLNLGFRYEFFTMPQEVSGFGSAVRDLVRDAAGTVSPELFGKNPSLRNFSPRFGFAWDVRGNGQTAVRGGFGLLYDVGNLGAALALAAGGTPPFSSRSTVLTPSTITTLPLFFPPEAVGKSLRTIDYNLQQPHLMQYNLTVEHQLPWGMGATLAYGGSRGINLMQTKEGNPRFPQILPDGRKFWTGKDPRSNPNWDTIELRTAAGNSWYNSFQFGLAKRLSQGLQFQSSYTFSKAIDDTQGSTTESKGNPTDPSDRRVDKGLTDFDVTHNWKFNTIYRFPDLTSSTGAFGKLLNGWWMSGILSLQGGAPFDAVLSDPRSRSGVGGVTGATGSDRPNLVAGRKNDDIVSGVSAGCLGVPAGQKLGGPERYFDPCAFTIPQLGTLGNAGRNILRDPGFATLDFSLVKDTALGFLGESGKLEFRAEFFNILNRVNFSGPSSTVFAARANVEPPLGSAGRITSTASTSRQIQLALKILF